MRVPLTRMVFLGMLLVFLLASCTTILMETGKKAFEDRTTEDQVTDPKIGAGILARLSDKDTGLLLDVSIDTWEQRVLLTGTLDDPAVRDEVLQLVKSDTRIKQVYDEIHIVTLEEKERRRKQKMGSGMSIDSETGKALLAG